MDWKKAVIFQSLNGHMSAFVLILSHFKVPPPDLDSLSPPVVINNVLFLLGEVRIFP